MLIACKIHFVYLHADFADNLSLSFVKSSDSGATLIILLFYLPKPVNFHFVGNRRHPSPTKEMLEPLLRTASSVGLNLDVSSSKALAESLDNAKVTTSSITLLSGCFILYYNRLL